MILIIAIAVVPAKDWPDVLRFFGKLARYVRNIVWEIQDGLDNMENEIAKDLPVDELTQKTMSDMIETFSTPIRRPLRPARAAARQAVIGGGKNKKIKKRQ